MVWKSVYSGLCLKTFSPILKSFLVSMVMRQGSSLKRGTTLKTEVPF